MITNSAAADPPTAPLRVAYLGNGISLHLVDEHGILCNRWGTVNGTWQAPEFVVGVQATCKRCAKIHSNYFPTR